MREGQTLQGPPRFPVVQPARSAAVTHGRGEAEVFSIECISKPRHGEQSEHLLPGSYAEPQKGVLWDEDTLLGRVK